MTDYGMSYLTTNYLGRTIYNIYLVGYFVLVCSEMVYCLLHHSKKREVVMAKSCILVLFIIGSGLMMDTFIMESRRPAFPATAILQPLAVVFAYAMSRKTKINILLREELDYDTAAKILLIQDAGKGLLGIINDILDLSKIEAGKYEIIDCEYELGTVISDVRNLSHAKLKGSDVRFEIEIEKNVPSVLYGDPIRVKQILINIIGNVLQSSL